MDMDIWIYIAQWKVFIGFIGNHTDSVFLYIVYSWVLSSVGKEGTLAEFTNNKSECSQSNRFRRTEDVIYVDGMDGMIVWYSFTNCLFLGWGANTIAARDLEHVLIVLPPGDCWLLLRAAAGKHQAGHRVTQDPGRDHQRSCRPVVARNRVKRAKQEDFIGV